MRNRSAMLALLFLVMFGSWLPAQGKNYTCLPTCSEVDGQMFSLAGSGLSTFGASPLNVRIVVPPEAIDFEFGIFDADTGPPHWDRSTDPVEYVLWEDPLGDGSVMTEVGRWLSNDQNPVSGALYSTSVGGVPAGLTPDNRWFDIRVTTAETARGGASSDCPTGHYCYRFAAGLTAPDGLSESNFKIRSTGFLRLPPSPFSIVGAIRNLADVEILSPSLEEVTISRYSGQWSFRLDVPEGLSNLTVWDGDVDFGSWDCLVADTDDPDTCANSDSVCTVNNRTGALSPFWSGGRFAFTEGVALGNPQVCGPTTGAPNDNQNPLLPQVLPGVFTRGESVNYVVDTVDASFRNFNPSGNQEWEQFRIEIMSLCRYFRRSETWPCSREPSRRTTDLSSRAATSGVPSAPRFGSTSTENWTWRSLPVALNQSDRT